MKISSFLALALTVTLPLFGQGTVTLIPSQDATLYEPGNLTSNGGGNMIVGMTANCSERRSLVKFDVAGSLPAGAIIQDVTLSLFVIGGSATPLLPNAMEVTFAPVLQAWGEGTVNPVGSQGQGGAPQPGDSTWIHSMFPSTTWINPGGDFGPPSGVLGISTAGRGALSSYRSTTLKADVQNWLDNPATNHGYLLYTLQTACQFTRVLGTRETTTPTQLTITYTLGGAPQASVSYDGYMYPGTTPDRILIANGLPSLGNLGFGLVFPVLSPAPTLYASIPGATNYIASLDGYTFIDIGIAATNLANGFGPFPGTPNPITGYPEWSFPLPNAPALSNLFVTFQGYGFGPFGSFETSNALTVRLGL